jgi:hypothetical protein
MYNELVRAHIDPTQVHCVRSRGALSEGLPEASVLEKTDLVHGSMIGVFVGAGMGLLLSILAALFKLEGFTFNWLHVTLSMVTGGLMGFWIASLVGSALPNSKLKEFQPELEQGKILMMVDVQDRQVREISNQSRKHPEVVLRKLEPSQ